MTYHFLNYGTLLFNFYVYGRIKYCHCHCHLAIATFTQRYHFYGKGHHFSKIRNIT